MADQRFQHQRRGTWKFFIRNSNDTATIREGVSDYSTPPNQNHGTVVLRKDNNGGKLKPLDNGDYYDVGMRVVLAVLGCRLVPPGRVPVQRDVSESAHRRNRPVRHHLTAGGLTRTSVTSVSDEVDAYIARSDRWAAEMTALRPILLDAGLVEAIKWAKPCYGHDGKNIAIVQEMKEFLALMFFKGALLADPDGVLEEQGPNSRSARRLEFTSVADVERLADTVRRCVAEAIDVEAHGLSVGPAARPGASSPNSRTVSTTTPSSGPASNDSPRAVEREYNLYFSGAKQATTRAARVDKYADKIRAGKGLAGSLRPWPSASRRSNRRDPGVP